MAKTKKTAGKRHKIDPDAGVKFTKENQPSPEAKKEGWKKKKLLADISEMIASGDFAALRDKIAKLFGVVPSEVDFETLADLRQLEKAISKADTRAYNAYKDRLRGKPAQKIEGKGEVTLNTPAFKWKEL